MNATDLRDDPRLTAYALGELDPDQRVEVERLLAADPDARAELARISELAAALGAELGSEAATGPSLTVAQRAAIARAAAPAAAARPLRWAWLAAGGALAAGLLAVVSVAQLGAPRTAAAPTADVVAKREVDARREVDAPRDVDARRYATGPSATVAPPSPASPASSASPAAPMPLPSGSGEKSIDDAPEQAARSVASPIPSVAPSPAVAPPATAAPSVPSAAPVQSEALVAAAPESTKREEEGSGAFLAIGAGRQPAHDGAARSGTIRSPTAKPSPDAAGGHADQPLAARDRKAVFGIPDERRDASAAALAAPAPARADAKKPSAPGGRPLTSSPGFSAVDEPQLAPGSTTVGGETYNQRQDNPFLAVERDPLSTFSLDVDTASYSNVRRFLQAGRLPPRDAVRIEELINYFPYRYEAPRDGMPFAIDVELAPCPWNGAHQLVRVGLKGKELAAGARPPANLVFLVDVSGSMEPANRLPLIKTGLSLLTQQLRADDRVAIVTYANGSGVALPPTSGADKRAILLAIDKLKAAGGTNGGAGLQLAYETARAGFVRGGANRVILCTDGDFNVGVTDRDELVRTIQGLAASGVFLSVMGVGQDNLRDATMELLADRGNGHYAYLDTAAEAQKVLVEQLDGTLVAIAKDVKVQVEFNPARVAGYRLIGYEKRLLADRDFNDDRKDAGDIGAGHTVTALYELVPAGGGAGEGDGLRYRAGPGAAAPDALAHELMTVKLRYKEPASETSKLIVGTVTDAMARSQPSPDLRLAAAVAEFGMLLRGSAEPGMGWPQVREQAATAARVNGMDYAQEFVQLVDRAMQLAGLGWRER